MKDLRPPRQASYMTKGDIANALTARSPEQQVRLKLEEKKALMADTLQRSDAFSRTVGDKIKACERNGVEIGQQIENSIAEMARLQDEERGL